MVDRSSSPYLFQNDALGVRHVVEEDLATLQRWMSDPRVLEWYEGRDQVFDAEKTREKFLDESDDTVRCIVELEQSPLGYIQFLELPLDEKVELEYDLSLCIYGIDQFIGEPDQWGKGIGTQLLTAITKYVCSEFHPDLIVLDPQVANVRAIHVYEKCGFRPARVRARAEHHEGEWKDCLLMELQCKPDMS